MVLLALFYCEFGHMRIFIFVLLCDKRWDAPKSTSHLVLKKLEVYAKQ